ncbi:transcription factor IIA, alpha/beta subunit [Xylariaceae sp. AK1471]|nr:transcription factor IIA, alpha/beta subunit [Xylariaceae sp. AK1471]
MSNSQVGGVYQQIINDVIAASRVDFEEGGIDESVLEQLRKGWQKKLSQQQLAVFPWDPKPDPPPAPAAAAPPQPNPGPSASLAPPNGNGYGQQQQQPTTQAMPMSMPMQASQPTGDARIKTEPTVKIEPGLEGNQMVQPVSQGDPQNVAQQRVIAQLQNQYGDRAAATINKLREQPGVGVAQPHNQQQRMQNPAMPQAYPGQYQNNPQQQQYRPNMPHNPAVHQQQQQQRIPMPNNQRPPTSQTDGAGDDDSHVGVLIQQSRDGKTTEMGRVEIDSLLHAQIAARAKAMEGGGLMLPLKRASKGKSVSYHKSRTNAETSQFDGPDDDLKDEDDESDEDAINSDLDDPDDNVEENEDDEEAGQIMLCMYDKVQRVKNKWKCVLKDGVLNVNGKDYVFHKATGEYEW